MNLQQELLRTTSKAQVLRIVQYIGSDPIKFDALVTVFLGGSYRATQRASWILSVCIEHHPELAKPHLKKLVKNLKQPGLHSAVKRNTVRLLQFVNIPASLHGDVATVCFNFLQDNKEPIAVRAFSMTVLANIARSNPDLKRELMLMLEDILPYGSAGMISRARKTIKQLETI
ncbi:MAG: hypothetical protein KF687_10955 [Cyclobacteriaceae bacterium]|nr:hypothetical protein [Cyclobacteriaceae bacterium]